MAQANSVSIELKVFSDATVRTFNNGGSIVTFNAGFLESAHFSKEENKMKYKNGFITCKKNLGEKLPDDKKRQFTSIKKDDRVCVFGHLGFEEWESKDGSGKKNNRVVLIIDNIYLIGAPKPAQQQQRQQSHDDGPYGDSGGNGGYGDREDIPF